MAIRNLEQRQKQMRSEQLSTPWKSKRGYRPSDVVSRGEERPLVTPEGRVIDWTALKLVIERMLLRLSRQYARDSVLAYAWDRNNGNVLDYLTYALKQEFGPLSKACKLAQEAKPQRISRFERERKIKRAELSRQLRKARKRLLELNALVSELGCQVEGLQNTLTINLNAEHLMQLPSVPAPSIPCSKLGDGLPSVSGIYFVWRDGRLIYIGQSVNISNRCRFGHHVASPGDLLSWVPVEVQDLTYAECFYIALARPSHNRGTPA